MLHTKLYVPKYEEKLFTKSQFTFILGGGSTVSSSFSWWVKWGVMIDA